MRLVSLLLLALAAGCRGQGLAATSETLGAGELAAVDALAQFQDLLDVSVTFTGGRGGGGRGGSGSGGGRGGRRGAWFADTQSLQQLQLQAYHLGGSPTRYASYNTSQTPGGANLLPRLRDQRSCSTCVAHATAAAVEAAVASTMRLDARGWQVSAPSIYYCSYGGKTCATGMSISEAMSVVQDEPELVRLPTCGLASLAEPEVGSWTDSCAKAAAACPLDNSTLPWLSCSFKSLSTFWQIQQHIRLHGTVVTRITIYDDFKPTFDASKTGADNPAYTKAPSARALYGHAAIIVGYDNEEQTFTMLNSWGTSSTADGLFKIKMGQASVGTPEETFGLLCEPRLGDQDPHGMQPWRRQARKPVRLARPEDRDNIRAACYLYTALRGETASSIADAFAVDVRALVRDERNRAVFPLKLIGVELDAGMTVLQLTSALRTVKAAELVGAAEPFLACNISGGGGAQVVNCTLGTVSACAGDASNCTLWYSEPDVAAAPEGKTLYVCGISAADGQFARVARLDDPAASQPRALRALLDILGFADTPVPELYCSSSAWDLLHNPTNGPFLEGAWVQGCDADGYITHLDMAVARNRAATDAPRLDEYLMQVLLELPRLRVLSMMVNDGSLPPQLGALTELQELSIKYWCLTGPLPNNYAWPSLTRLSIMPDEDLTKQGWSLDPRCGVSSTLPPQWGGVMKNLRELLLPFSRFSGSLPDSWGGMRRLETLDLSHNALTGVLPATWAKTMRSSLRYLDVSHNDLKGSVPLSWSVMDELRELTLAGNMRMEGCVPLTPFTTLAVDFTGIEGLCSSTRIALEQAQLGVLTQLLPKVFNADGKRFSAISRTVGAISTPLALADFKQSGTPSLSIVNGDDNGRGSVELVAEIISGTVCATELWVSGGGLDTSLLPQLAAGLPWLRTLACYDCTHNAGVAAASQLPPELAAAAPLALKRLVLKSCGLQGSLPDAWGAWATIERIELAGNALASSLPPAWQGMAGLKYLDVVSNALSGTLPAAWGAGSHMRAELRMHLSSNALTGLVPSTWTHFTGGMFVYDTNISQDCVPDQLMFAVYPWDKNKPCSLRDPQVAALIAIKQLLLNSSAAGAPQLAAVLATWDATKLGVVVKPGLTAPVYCRQWSGVACDSANQVTALRLGGLMPGPTGAGAVRLSQLVAQLLQLPALQELDLHGNGGLLAGSGVPQQLALLTQLQRLDLSSCGLTGPLPDLGALSELRHLNFSGNTGVRRSSMLPLWGSLGALEELDLSLCELGGPLPSTWAAMQRLRVLQLACSTTGRFSGPLPDAWGLLARLEAVNVSGCGLSGQLPSAWADPATLASAAAAAMADAKAAAAATAAAAAASPAGGMEGAAAPHSATAAAAMQSALQQAASSGAPMRLRTLDVSRNPGLGGSLPASWAGLPLQELRLVSCNFSGSLAARWAQLQRLEVLDASNNRLTGTLPDAWAGLAASLRELHLARNRLSGQLPPVWRGLRRLVVLDVGGNRLHGGVPREWGTFAAATHALVHLDLSNNPCMAQPGLGRSVTRSGIARGGRVAVATSCCAPGAKCV